MEQDNSQYELHVELIALLKQLQLHDQLETARLAMHDIYPMTEGIYQSRTLYRQYAHIFFFVALWLDWIQDAKKQADTVNGQIKLLQLYDQAEQDYLCK